MSYQIEDIHLVEVEDFSEPWAKEFPDSHASSYNVNLNVSGATVKQELFVSCDGGRYFVPIPEISRVASESKSANHKLYYDRNSLRFLLGKRIGKFYTPVTTLEEFATWRGIEVI